MTETQSTLSRRTFVKGSLASLAATGAVGSALYGCAPQTQAGNEEMPATGEEAAPDEIHWSQCNVNCGGNCIFQWHSRDGKVLYMETDNTGDNDLQARACLRGRSMRRWLNSPDRLLYPMKRVGKRGEGKFEQISWDEAIDTIAEKLKYTIDTYGNDAIHRVYSTGMYSTTGNPTSRLLNCLGGYLERHYDYSANMILGSMPYMYGDQFSRTTTCIALRSLKRQTTPTWWLCLATAPLKLAWEELMRLGISLVFARAFSAAEARLSTSTTD